MREQLMNIVRPNLVFRVTAIDHDIGCAAVAPVEDDDAITEIGEIFCLQLDATDVAPTAWRQRHPGPLIAEDLIVDVYAADICGRHSCPPIFANSGLFLGSPQILRSRRNLLGPRQIMRGRADRAHGRSLILFSSARLPIGNWVMTQSQSKSFRTTSQVECDRPGNRRGFIKISHHQELSGLYISSCRVARPCILLPRYEAALTRAKSPCDTGRFAAFCFLTIFRPLIQSVRDRFENSRVDLIAKRA